MEQVKFDKNQLFVVNMFQIKYTYTNSRFEPDKWSEKCTSWTEIVCVSDAGFQLSFGHFTFYLLNIVMTSLAGCSVALVFSASTRQHSIGTILTALVWVCMMVFSGLLVKVCTVPLFLQWIKWFSIFRYSMNVRRFLTIVSFWLLSSSSSSTLTLSVFKSRLKYLHFIAHLCVPPGRLNLWHYGDLQMYF